MFQNQQTSDDREKDQHREACGSEYSIVFRIPGIPHSAVEKVETNRKAKVRRLIGQFENHPNRNMLKSEEINHFSRESKDLITEMGNNEIFEFNEASSKNKSMETLGSAKGRRRDLTRSCMWFFAVYVLFRDMFWN